MSVTTSVGSGSSSSSITTNVYRQSPYLAEPFTWYGTFPVGAHSWSNMVYAPVSCAKGYAAIDLGYDTASEPVKRFGTSGGVNAGCGVLL